MEIERLERLASLLERHNDSRGFTFDIRKWGSRSPSCGTAGCAIGLACLSEEFLEDGLSFTWERGSTETIRLIPKFGSKVDWAAVWTFFDISLAQASRMFHLLNYRRGYHTSAVRTARRIRAMVRLERYKIRRSVKSSIGLLPYADPSPEQRAVFEVMEQTRRELVDA